MNQFKQAKQKLIAQGKEVEHITDLKTAGVKNTNSSQKEETEKAKAVTESVQKANDEKITPEVVSVPTPKIENLAESTPSSVAYELEPLIVEEIPVAAEAPIPAIVEEKVPETVPTPIAVSSAPTLTEEAPVQNVTVPSPEPVYVAPVYQPQVTQPSVSQPVVHQKAQPAKKAIPNIFAPKEEPKSMRKSLVLKPTSVKKAESYCSKNGGSFNELIQTLLDNFINEYGL